LREFAQKVSGFRFSAKGGSASGGQVSGGKLMGKDGLAKKLKETEKAF
jgi:hypothetical protein